MRSTLLERAADARRARLQAAMDLAERTLGAKQFAIVGMCSGVEHAMAAAAADARVVALSLFDGFAFPERRARWERNVRRALAAPAHPSFPGKARRWLQRHFLRSYSTTPMPGFFAEKRAPDANAAWFGATLNSWSSARWRCSCCIRARCTCATAAATSSAPFGRQPFTQSLQYEFMGEVDHTVCTERGQQLFLQTVGDWVTDRCFGASSGAAQPSQSRRERAGAERAMPTTWAAP
jgi:hypothetical protein